MKNWVRTKNTMLFSFIQVIRSEIKIAKKKIDNQKLATRIIALILAGLMVLSIAFTLIWYLIAK